MNIKASRFVGVCTLVVSLISFSGIALYSHSVSAQTTAANAPAAATAAVPATPASPAPANSAQTTVVENPYGIESLWKASDWVAKFVLLILAIMSLGSWYILAVKYLEQSKMMRHARSVAKDFWTAKSVSEGEKTLPKDSAFQFIAQAGIMATEKHAGLAGKIPLTDWITMSITRAIDRVNSNMQNGLSFLATVGSIAPFVGLFGTVWGIYHALTAIGASGQASIDKVAGPVGEALLMTAIGLAVAVPAVLAYNWLVRRNKAVMDEVRGFGSDLHSVLLSATQGE